VEDSFWAYNRFYQSNTEANELSRHQYADIKVWMVDSILAKVDFMSMAHSLEVRVPYLDPQFVEFAISIPAHLKLKWFNEKYIFKKTFSGDIPQAILKRKKAGFNIPIGKWLRGELRGLLTDIVCEKNIKQVGFLKWSYISNMMNDHLRCKQDHGYQLLSLLHFCLWHQRFIGDQDIAVERAYLKSN